MKKERRAVQRRISVLAFFMLMAVVLIVGRYAWLQLVQGNVKLLLCPSISALCIPNSQA